MEMNEKNMNEEQLKTAQQNYQSYNEMVHSVQTGVENLETVCSDLEMKEYGESLSQTHDRMKNRMFRVGIMGEFRRGKSTVINALLGEEVVPADIVPCTATLNTIRYAPTKHAVVNYKDGSSEEVKVEDLTDYITKEAERSETVKDAVVYYPCHFCQNGVEIIDTPGLNDDERMTEISTQVLPTLDAIVMVLVPDAPFSQSEAEFVRTKVMTSDLGRIIFVLNKIDIVDEEDRPKLIANIKRRIRENVLEKCEKLYGVDSKEYASAKGKIADIRLYPISARDALKGRLKGDRKKLEASGQIEFELALSRLLTEERGLLELIGPVNSVMTISDAARDIIDMRLNTSNMDVEKFKEIQEEEGVKVREARAKKTNEIKQLKLNAKALYSELLPDVEKAYKAIEDSAIDWVNGLDISPESVKSERMVDETSKTLAVNLQKTVEQETAAQVEKLFVKVQDRLEDESKNTTELIRSVGDDMQSIIDSIHTSQRGNVLASAAGGLLGVTAAAFLLNDLFAGAGGALEGYRANGFSGAVAGGLLGVVGSVGAGLAMLSLGVVGFPALIAMGLGGTLLGGGGTRLIFKKKIRAKRAEQVRENLRGAVAELLSGLRKEQAIERWLRELTDHAYNMLAEKLDKELENMLKTMQGTMTQIKMDLQKSETEREHFVEDMKKLGEKLDDITSKVLPVREELNRALNSKNEGNA